MHSRHLSGLEDTQCLLLSNTECKHFCLFTKKAVAVLWSCFPRSRMNVKLKCNNPYVFILFVYENKEEYWQI